MDAIRICRKINLLKGSKSKMAEITYRIGDIFTFDVEAIVNPVNCVGVMGRGLALQFKQRFPANFHAWTTACKTGTVQPGRMFLTDCGIAATPRYLINFPTKRHWRSKSRIADIDAGLIALAGEIETRAIRSIAIPPLGAGLGGLDRENVFARIEAALCDLPDVRVILCQPPVPV